MYENDVHVYKKNVHVFTKSYIFGFTSFINNIYYSRLYVNYVYEEERNYSSKQY